LFFASFVALVNNVTEDFFGRDQQSLFFQEFCDQWDVLLYAVT
jgi:hypothetical protein